MSHQKVNVPLEIKGNTMGLKEDLHHQMGFIYEFGFHDFTKKSRQPKKTRSLRFVTSDSYD